MRKDSHKHHRATLYAGRTTPCQSCNAQWIARNPQPEGVTLLIGLATDEWASGSVDQVNAKIEARNEEARRARAQRRAEQAALVKKLYAQGHKPSEIMEALPDASMWFVRDCITEYNAEERKKARTCGLAESQRAYADQLAARY